MKKSQKIIYVFLVLTVLFFAFYWYEWRPSQIKQACSNLATPDFLNETLKSNGIISTKDQYDKNYERCLEAKGL